MHRHHLIASSSARRQDDVDDIQMAKMAEELGSCTGPRLQICCGSLRAEIADTRARIRQLDQRLHDLQARHGHLTCTAQETRLDATMYRAASSSSSSSSSRKHVPSALRGSSSRGEKKPTHVQPMPPPPPEPNSAKAASAKAASAKANNSVKASVTKSSVAASAKASAKASVHTRQRMGVISRWLARMNKNKEKRVTPDHVPPRVTV